MMKFIQCGPTGSDATAPYDVILDSPYTVKDLVCEILTKHEWGEIRLPGYTFKYRGSSCDAMPPDLLQLQIREVKASGGYGNMNYYIKTKVKMTPIPIIDSSTLSKEQKGKRIAMCHITTVNGIDIVTVEKNGQIFIPVKPICDAIGIAFQPQHIKLQEDDFLAPTVTIIVTVAADGKEREMACLPLKYIYGWLATINPGKVAPEARGAVSNYRRECYEVLYDHFAGAAFRQQEQNEAEKSLLDRKAAALEAISGHKKAISEEQAEIKKVDDALARLQSERLNPQPTLF